MRRLDKKNRNSIFIKMLFFMGIWTILSCEKTPSNQTEDYTFEEGIWLVNEGNFNSGLGSISYINTNADTIMEQVFERVNGRKLGDVVQSLYVEDDRLYIVVNNSQKIEVVNRRDFKSVGTISGLHSPRYIEQWGSNDELVVSNFRSPWLQIINRTSLVVVDSIAIATANPATCWTEQLLRINDELWIANMKDGQIQIVEAGSESIDSIAVAFDPGSMVMDKNGAVWVLSSGGLCPICEMPTLVKIDANTKSVVATYLFEDEGSPSSLVVDERGEYLYYLYQGGIYKMSINDMTLASTPLAVLEGRNLYRLSFAEGKLWVSDAVNFLQQGSLLQIDVESGEVLKVYEGGFIPSGVY